MRSMCVSNDLDSSMRIVVLFLRVIILEGLSGELVFRMYIGIVDVTKSYYFWSGVLSFVFANTVNLQVWQCTSVHIFAFL